MPHAAGWLLDTFRVVHYKVLRYSDKVWFQLRLAGREDRSEYVLACTLYWQSRWVTLSLIDGVRFVQWASCKLMVVVCCLSDIMFEHHVKFIILHLVCSNWFDVTMQSTGNLFSNKYTRIVVLSWPMKTNLEINPIEQTNVCYCNFSHCCGSSSIE